MGLLKNIIQILSTRADYWAIVLSLPLFLGLWLASTSPAGLALLKRLQFILPTLGLLMLALFIWFNWVFLHSPIYLGPMSHLQPQIADVSWYFATGRPVYHGPDSPEVYNLLYGPWLYIFTGTFERLLGPGIFSAKLGGELAVGLELVLLFFLLRKKAGGWFALFGTGLFCALLIVLDPVESLVRADVFIVLGVVIGCWAAQSQAKLAPYIFGLMAGLCFNLKIHAPIYFLPLLWPAWQAGHRGKSLLIAFVAAVVMAVLPFVIFPNISLPNYWWTLRTASGHGLDPNRLLESVEWVFLLALPLTAVIALAYAQNASLTIEKLQKLKPFLGLILLNLILLLPFASKFGSGPHHFLPTLVVLLWLAGEFTPLVKQWLGSPSLLVIGANAMLLSWLGGCLVVGLTRSYQDAAWLKSSQAWAEDINADLDGVLTKYGSSHVILMGAGNDHDYIDTFFRTKLVFAGMPDGIEPGPLMEFAFTGEYTADLERTVAAIKQDHASKKILWLIPKGDEPFSMSTYYAQVMHGEYQNKDKLFSAHSIDYFKKAFHLIGSTQFYDLYSSEAS